MPKYIPYNLRPYQIDPYPQQEKQQQKTGFYTGSLRGLNSVAQYATLDK